jgi:phospholipid/cholesterol/gamma-HCH transport system ATP-binding protein
MVDKPPGSLPLATPLNRGAGPAGSPDLAAPPDSGAEPIIQVENVRTGFGDFVLHESVSFEVRRGEIFAILGGSGCGKTVLLKNIIGLYTPLAGRVLIGGVDVARATGEARIALIKRFGVMYQLGALFGNMTLTENIRLPLEEYTELPDEAMDLVARLKLRLVQLQGAEDLAPAEISGGMMKRAAIARAMALDPDILFLDEPSGGLDPITSAELDQLILRLRASLGITFVVITHELPSIFTIADRCIMLDKEAKGIIAEGKPAELRDHSDNPRVRQFFNRRAEPEAAAA